MTSSFSSSFLTGPEASGIFVAALGVVLGGVT